jgi:arylsulfatase A
MRRTVVAPSRQSAAGPLPGRWRRSTETPLRCIAALAILLAGLPSLAVAQATTERPNIVLILADDLGYGEVGCYGQKLIQTPNIDRLAAEGMRFTQFYSGCHVCAPSRSTLMTGQHTGHTPVRNNGGARCLYAEDVTVAEVLKQAGYATGGFGKWGLGTENSTGAPWKQGFDEFFGYLHQVHAHFYYPYWLWTNDVRFFLPENEGRKRSRYSHDEIQRQALAFIRRQKDAPFFCYIPYTLPHVELVVPEDSVKPYCGKWKETPLPDPRPGYIGAEEPYATFAGMVSRLDRSVGEVLALLKDLKLEDNTVVFFSSDNGPQGDQWQRVADFFHGAGPLRGYKGGFYEGGIRVPLIVRWPGKIKAGTTSDHLCAFWDVLPTAAEIAGVAPPPGLDGTSFLPALLGRKQEPHEFLYWEMPAGQGRSFAVRLGDWKAVKPKPAAKVELYDLKDDLAETRNLADQQPALVKKLQTIADKAHTAERNYPPENPRPSIKDYVR